MSLSKNGLSDQEKEMIIAQALETDEGRTALAQAKKSSPLCWIHSEKECCMQEHPDIFNLLIR